MSVEPPSSGRPTGPPSGPLSGPTRPSAGPPSGQSSGPSGSSGPPSGPPSPPTGGGPEGGPPGPRRPWWRSAPGIALAVAVALALVALGIVLTRSDGGGKEADGEVFLQAASKPGPDPFTESTATDSSTQPVSPSPAATAEGSNAVTAVDGGTAGLYGGNRNASSCDVEKQIRFLAAAPDRNRAFASVAAVAPADVPAYLRGLTPVQLRMDTRVTNHGYRDGAATSYQAVLQTGTAVLVDGHGVPRVRCACGNPLTPPVAQQGTPKPTGDSWPSYRASNVVVVTPSTTVVNVFVLHDDDGGWFARPRGDTGGKDRPTRPPAQPSPSVSVTTPSASSSSPASPSSPPPSSESPPQPPPSSSEAPPPQPSPTPPQSPPGDSAQ
ncbi:DUF6777 domain-containing protein [Streptomyces sp. bgisy153]|uniref:DUF6777 domain-containing protein n=1 Tax=Streptomyces sp. bgisy153 TaxID=3413793 RepID=UPI003D753139